MKPGKDIRLPRRVLRLVIFAAATSIAGPVAFADPLHDRFSNGVAPYLIRAMTNTLASNWDKVIDACNRAIRLNPSAVDAYRGRATAYFEKGVLSAVVSNYSEVIRLEPSSGSGYACRGYAYAKQGELDKAIKDYEQAARLSPDPYRGLGDVYLQKREFAGVITNYNKVIRLDPGLMGAYYTRGYAYGATSNFDLAIKDFSTVLNQNRSSQKAYLYRADAYLGNREFDKAMEDLDQAIRLDPRDSEALSRRAYIYAKKSDLEKALNDINECIRLDPTNAAAFAFRGGRYLARRDFGRAASDFAKAIQLAPRDERCCNELAWLLATCPDDSVRDGKRAVEAAKKACELTSWRNWQYLDTLAAAYAEKGDFSDAVKYQKMAIDAQGSGKPGEEAALKRRLELYQRREPYREPREQ